MPILESRQARERRIAQPLALFQLVLIKAIHIMPRRGLYDLISRIEGLQDNLSAAFTATRAARHLRQHLKDTFRGKRIGKIQADISQHDPNQCHKRKVESLG